MKTTIFFYMFGMEIKTFYTKSYFLLFIV